MVHSDIVRDLELPTLLRLEADSAFTFAVGSTIVLRSYRVPDAPWRWHIPLLRRLGIWGVDNNSPNQGHRGRGLPGWHVPLLRLIPLPGVRVGRGVFINYRGEGSHSYGALLYTELVRQFGADLVFLDSESIPAGADFTIELVEWVRSAAVVLAVIGLCWLTATDVPNGRRRIEDPADWIRRELAEAFAAGVRVIPILTDGAELPRETDLPAEIAALGRCQARHLRRREPTADLARIVTDLTSLNPTLAAAARHRSSPQQADGMPLSPSVQAQQAPRSATRPRQLPAIGGSFTGRTLELAALTRTLDQVASSTAPVVISALRGAGGMGKTWLAVHWARQHVAEFPDGQLFVDLRGFAPSGGPMSPGTAIRGFLEALGVPAQAVPMEFAARQGLYRSLMADQRMLLVLDNARDSEQVLPLLPGSPSCTVIVTSRDRLNGVITAAGARSLALDALVEQDARALLMARLGARRMETESDAVAELLAYCAGFPLALSVVAGRAESHEDFPLAPLARELRDTTTRLGVLDGGDPAASLPAALSLSYHALPPDRAVVFQLLGLAPGPDIGVHAVATMTGYPVAVARQELVALERASLIQQHLPDRYRLHDLIRLYAAEMSARGGSPDRHAPALRRLVDFTVDTAYAADRVLDPHRQPIDIESSSPGLPLADETAALAWFDAEHLCLPAMQETAVAHAWYDRAWQIAWAQQTYRQRQGHLHALIVAWRFGLDAADRLGDPGVQAIAHRFLGHVYARASEHDAAHEHLVQALAWSEQAGDVPGQIHAHRSLAWVWSDRGDAPRALDAATRSLQLAQQYDEPVWEARAHTAVGRYSARLNRLASAREHCTAALELFRRHGDHDGEAVTINNLGYIAHRAGRLQEALALYQQALDMFEGSDNVYNEPLTLGWMGQVYVLLGDTARARASWERALHLYQVRNEITAAERLRAHLAVLDQPDTPNRHGTPSMIDPPR